MPDESSLSDAAAGALRVVEAIGYDRDKRVCDREWMNKSENTVRYLKIILKELY